MGKTKDMAGKIRQQFFVVEQLGPKQSLTPEGFLLCEEVPVARTGMMVYGPNETPIEAGPDGIVKIFRDEKEVFRPDTLASIQGKPVVDDHPEENVNPENWKELTIGVGFNPRRGIGAMDDLLLCDLLITVPEAIQAVQEGKREISLGYEADYIPTDKGVGYQRDIFVNHIALVDSGRCGLRCAIGDHNSLQQKEVPAMATKEKSLIQKLRDAFKTKDEAGMESALKELTGDIEEGGEGAGSEGESHVHIHLPVAGGGAAAAAGGDEDLGGTGAGEGESDFKFSDEEEARFSALEQGLKSLQDGHQEILAKLDGLKGGGAAAAGDAEESEETKQELAEEAPTGTKDAAMAAKDSSYLHESFRDAMSIAEILVPGIKMPTFDQAAKPGVSLKALCGFRRQALDAAWAVPATREILTDLLAGKPLVTKDMSCGQVRQLFTSAGAIKRRINNDASRGHSSLPRGTQAKTGVHSVADLNAKNKEYWKGKAN